MIKSRYGWSFVGLSCLLLFLHTNALATDCAVGLTAEQVDKLASEGAANQFLKGFYLGCSLLVFSINIYVSARQKRHLFLILFALAVVLIQLVYMFGESMAVCGYAGAHASYYGVELLALLVVFSVLMLTRNRRLKENSPMIVE